MNRAPTPDRRLSVLSGSASLLRASAILVTTFLGGCGDSGPLLPEPGQVPIEDLLTGGMDVVVDPSGRAPLSAELSLRTPVPSTVTVRGLDAEPFSRAAGEARTEHRVPILGLSPGERSWVEVRVEVPGGAHALAVLGIDTDPLPSFFPDVTIVKANRARMEPGWTLSNFSIGTGEDFLSYPFMFDSSGRVRWYLDLSELGGMSYLVKSLANGNLLVSHSDRLFEYDLVGREVNRWDMPAFFFHHDVVEKPDGNLIILVSRAGSEVMNDHIVELDRSSGSVVREWDLRESLDVHRRDFPSSVDANWAHANGLAYDSEEDAIIVSIRNQTAVVKLTMDNDLVWILGAHRGWGLAGPDGDGADTSEFLLTAVDDAGQPFPEEVQLGQVDGPGFSWVWGQHAPVLLPDGKLFVFDNGNTRNFDDRDLFSRGVEYEIDEERMTVRQTWQYGRERGTPYFSAIISNVQHLPETGNRLIAPGIAAGGRAYVTEVTYPDRDEVFEAVIEFKNEMGSGELVWGEFDLVYRSRRVEAWP